MLSSLPFPSLLAAFHVKVAILLGRRALKTISLFLCLCLCSSSCVPSRYQKISQSVVLEEGQLLPVAPGFPLVHAFSIPPAGVLPASPVRPPTLMDSSAELILLQAPQVGGCKQQACSVSPLISEVFSKEQGLLLYNGKRNVIMCF